MTRYQPYVPSEGDQSTETAGHAGFLAWFAARVQEYVDRGKESNWASVSPRELMPFPYELQSCAEHVVALESTLREFLDLLDKGKLASMNLEEKARRLVRTPEEWLEWEKQDDAEFAKEERARERALLKTMTPEERKAHKARKELFKRMFNGKE